MTVSCPACVSADLVPFHSVDAVPVNSCLLVADEASALDFPRGDLRLAHCRACGFITNTAFDPSQSTYSPDYEETQGFSPRFQAYIAEVSRDWVDRYDLRGDIELSTRVDAAVWDESASRWRLRTDAGEERSCRFYVMASGCLSVPKSLDIPGAERFGGDVHLTSRWPHEGVDFTGKRVAVIGTGSSGIQSIPIIAAQADELTIFQRTPNFSLPAHNGPPSSEVLARLEADRDG